jgi:prepilin-type processing-associated H-X9-DG protein
MLAAENISYFVNPNASQVSPDLMTGDDNFEIHGVRVKSGVLEIWSNTPIVWSPDRHRFSGNIGMADGSVEIVNNSSLTNRLCSAGGAPIRLAIP